ncbi:MAG: molybdenum ABC transporter ATP-binding protein [Proteobacteria bacterium]|nr:molybdenum ABC transporter ATP-binding protein [Pseudomonadota bacterium]
MSLSIQARVKREGGFELNIDIAFPDREVSALFGASGSGKSTILRLLAGLDHIPGIRVSFNHMVWQDETTFVPPNRRHIGYVFQHLNLFPHLSVSGNLDYAEARRQSDGGLSRPDVLDILDLSSLLAKRPRQLSGGEQQRVAIARALLSNPDLIVMDEPLGSLDQAAKDRILPYLQRLHKTLEVPVIYVSHALDEILYFADTVFEIADGKITGQSSVIDFSVSGTHIHQPEAAAIVSCRVKSENEQFSLTELQFEDTLLLVSAGQLVAGESVRVKIPARDVSLSRQRNESSIINVIATTIEDIHDPGTGASAVVKLKCGNQFLLALITRKSLQELRFEIGESIFAQIKGVALMTQHDG